MMIVCGPGTPGEDGGAYVLPYIEATEGQRHGYRAKNGLVEWTRNAYHPADPKCPECKR